MGQYDANYGLVLEGKGKGQFVVRKPKDSGFFTKGQVRKMKQVSGANGQAYFILAKNKDKLQVFSLREQRSKIATR